jgi:hypothetical protein
LWNELAASVIEKQQHSLHDKKPAGPEALQVFS